MYELDFKTSLSIQTGVDLRIIEELFKKHFKVFDIALALIEKHNVDSEKLGKFWGDYLGFAYVDPNKCIVNQDYVKKVGINFIEINKVLPLYKFGKAVTVCTSNPTNPSIIELTQKKLEELVSPVFCFPFDIKTYLQSNNLK